jgi:hypothetical protein
VIRKQYESERDRQNEESICRWLCSEWKLVRYKLNPHWVIDYAIARKDDPKRITGLIEIRQRSFVWGDFPDVFCSASKIEAANKIRICWNLPVLFAVRDTHQEVRYCDLTALGIQPLHFDGRSTENMRDQWDQDLIAKIPINQFTKFMKGK